MIVCTSMYVYDCLCMFVLSECALCFEIKSTFVYECVRVRICVCVCLCVCVYLCVSVYFWVCLCYIKRLKWV